MRSILIESNRQIAASSRKQTDEGDIPYLEPRSVNSSLQENSQWTTHIKDGLQLLPGDSITLNSATTNVLGASGDFQTFLGPVNPPLKSGKSKVDNRVRLKFQFYVSANAQINFPLPTGSHTCTDTNGLRFGSVTDYGAVDMTGKNVFTPIFRQQVYPPGNSLTVPKTFTGLFYFGDTVQQNANKYISQTMNGDFAMPTSARGTDTALKARTGEVYGYHAWCENTPWVGLPGCQFGQNMGPYANSLNANVLNIDSTYAAEDFDGVTAAVRPTFESGSAEHPQPTAGIPQRNGNSNALKIYNNGIFNPSTLSCAHSDTMANVQHGVYQFPLRDQTNVATGAKANSITGMLYARDFDDWATSPGTKTWQHVGSIEPALYKGSYANWQPNDKRLYVFEFKDLARRNRGPFYDSTYNPVNKTFTEDHVNVKDRDDHWPHLIETEVEIEIPVGNISNARIAELVSDALKKRCGTPVDPMLPPNAPQTTGEGSENITVSPALYYVYRPNQNTVASPPVNEKQAGANIEKYRYLKHCLPSIASQLSFPFPTLTGFILDDKYNAQPFEDTTDLNLDHWDARDLEEVGDVVQPHDNLILGQGQNYKAAQGYTHYYPMMMAGDPAEWTTVCRLLPPIQAAPIALNLLPAQDENINWYEKYSLVTGHTTEFIPEDVPRRANNQQPSGPFMAANSYSCGEYGLMPCLFTSASSRGAYSPIRPSTTTEPVMAATLYNWTGTLQKDQVSAPAGVGDFPAQTFNIGPSRLSDRLYFQQPTKPMKTCAIQAFDVIPTNIIFDGQGFNASVWNEQYSQMEKHLFNTAAHVVGDEYDSLGPAFFDSTYVEWQIGRMSDSRSFPECSTANLYGTAADPFDLFGAGGVFDTSTPEEAPLQGREGWACYQPNVFLTNLMYSKTKTDAAHTSWSPANADTYTATDIREFLGGYKNAAMTEAGTYMLVNEANGFVDPASTYTSTANPQRPFAASPSASIYDLTDQDSQANADLFIGLPCYSCYAEEYIQSKTKPNEPYGFARTSRRDIKAHRYLPQNGNYTVEKAYAGEIDLGYIGNKDTAANKGFFTTKPPYNDFERYKRLFEKISTLNNGKGIGLLPIFVDRLLYEFYVAPHQQFPTNSNLFQVPFIGVICLEQRTNGYPLPATGEAFFFSPSIMQHDLHLPATTQQAHQQTQPPAGNNVIQLSESQCDESRLYQPQFVMRNSFMDGREPTANSPTSPYERPPDVDQPGTLAKVGVGGPMPSRSSAISSMQASSLFSLANTVTVGANDPAMTFDTSFNRYALQTLHTELPKGNGNFQLASQGSNTDPSAIEMLLNQGVSAFSRRRCMPRFYFRKFNDTRNALNWKQSTFNVQNGGTFFTDFCLPGYVVPGGLGIENTGFRMLACDQCDGNTVQQTFNDLAVDPRGLTVATSGDPDPSAADASLKLMQDFSNFEPGGCSAFISVLGDPTHDINKIGVLQCNPSPNSYPLNGTSFNVRGLGDRSLLPLEGDPTFEFAAWKNKFLYKGTIQPFLFIRSNAYPNTVVTSQCGAAICGYSTGLSTGEFQQVSGQSSGLFADTLFHRAGYDIAQIVPLFGRPSTRYDHSAINSVLSYTTSAGLQDEVFVKPVTTNASVTTSSTTALTWGFGTDTSTISSPMTTPMPMYISAQYGTAPASATAVSDSIIAARLPNKNSIPYLVLHSSLTESLPPQICGSKDASQFLSSSIAILTQNYAVGDNFYSFASDLIFPVTRPITITSISSAIRFPDGSSTEAFLGNGSAVVYRINMVDRLAYNEALEKEETGK